MRTLVKTALISAALIIGITTAAYASCRTVTYFQDGKMTVCTICDNYGNRTVTCI